MIVIGFGLGKRVVRGALKLLKRATRFCGCFILKRRVRPDIVVVVAPKRQVSTGIVQGVEELFVQQLVAKAAIEAFDEGPCCINHRTSAEYPYP